MSFIPSKDATLYYEEHGAGEPLILLPALLGTIESNWRRFIPEFARSFHVIAVDLRGHGRSNNPSAGLRLHALVGDLYSLYEGLEIESARICGYSLGGYIGLALGVQHPGRVQALMMHATKFFWTTDEVASAVQSFDAERLLLSSPSSGEALRRDHEAANGADGWRRLLVTSREFLKTLPDEGVSEKALERADFPVLVTVGDGDEMIQPGEAERLATALPRGEFRLLENADHSLQSVKKSVFLHHAFSFFRPGLQPARTVNL